VSNYSSTHFLFFCDLFVTEFSLILMCQIAKEEEKGVYLNFLNFLINDSIYLLDESLNKILELKEIEAEMANTVEWERRPTQEREERLRVFHQSENVSIVD
jgi:ubiquitin conjugation factor E4 B